MEPVKPVQMNIIQGNTYKKVISTMRPGFKRGSKWGSKWRTNRPRYPFLKFILKFQVATRCNSPDMTTVFHARPFGRFIEIQSRNQDPNFLGGSFSNQRYNKDNVRAPIQFRRDNSTIHFHINSTSVIRPVKQNQLSFFSIEIIKPLPVPVLNVL